MIARIGAIRKLQGQAPEGVGCAAGEAAEKSHDTLLGFLTSTATDDRNGQNAEVFPVPSDSGADGFVVGQVVVR